MKVLVLGSGAREHALVAGVARDPRVTEVVAAPGNPGIAALARCEPVDPLDAVAVAALAADVGADLVVVGPEAPLVAGVADAVRATGIPCFGPTAEAARLEGSKTFAKEVMNAAGVPTAEAIRRAIAKFTRPISTMIRNSIQATAAARPKSPRLNARSHR